MNKLQAALIFALFMVQAVALLFIADRVHNMPAFIILVFVALGILTAAGYVLLSYKK